MRSFDAAFDALRGLTNYETMARPPYGRRAMNLPRTRALLRALESPERSYPCLQVAGTKGKGTTATALAAMLRASGRRVGLYTSPHLFHVRERIAVDGEWISEADFAAGVTEILRHVAPLRGTDRCPTFFELMTALALLSFAKAGVDAAVLEVGLGGRLDATSVVRPLCSIVTHVGLDHTAVLGRTKALIAREKAGVAKRGVPLLSGVPAAGAAGRAVAETAARKGAPLLVAGRDFTVRTGAPLYADGRAETPVWVRTPEGGVSARPGVLGRALARDAGLAAAALFVPRVRRRLPVPEEAMARGLAALRMPGRIEIAGTDPLTVIDGAHNPDSARALVRAIREALPFKGVVAVVGGGTEKGLPSLVSTVAGLADGVRFVFTRPAAHPRAADPAELASTFPGAATAPDLPAALALAREWVGRRDLLLVTGSLYLAGEALSLVSSGSTECRMSGNHVSPSATASSPTSCC